MLNLKDLYTQKVYQPLFAAPTSTTTVSETNPPTGSQIGISIVEYDVRRYIDVRDLNIKLSYIITCTQRITIPNSSAYVPLSGSKTSFLAYPAMITNSLTLVDTAQALSLTTLLDYTPKTLNTAVSTSLSNSTATDESTGVQYSSGSSQSQSNSFSASTSLGFFGGDLTGGVSTSAGVENSSGTNRSLGGSSSFSAQQQTSTTSSMSIKDWGSYAQLDAKRQALSWIWGQEYPWNVIKYQAVDSNGDVLLPEFVKSRMTNGVIAFPPSELSMFGVDFVCKASWLVTPNLTSIPDKITFSSTFDYMTGSHVVSSPNGPANGGLKVTLDNMSIQGVTQPVLDLPLLALNPVILSPQNDAAIIGFIANKFDIFPQSQDAAHLFQITSGSNDLLVRGYGFTSVMSSNFSNGSVRMRVFFKLTDEKSDVSLYLKHWSSGGAGLIVTIVANGESTIIRHVDNSESEGGAINVSTVSLRFKDYTSINYCDYLNLGLNELDITISNPVPDQEITYTISAIAIG